MKATNLAEMYQLPLLDWASIETRLGAGVSQAPGTGGPDRHTCWLATINPDGSPHVTGVGALWADGCWWFETGKGTRKGKNLARDHRPRNGRDHGRPLGSSRLASQSRRQRPGTHR